MAATVEQIETEFGQLPTQLQLALLEADTFALKMSEMAADGDIQREVRQIEAEFAPTENDGLARQG